MLVLCSTQSGLAEARRSLTLVGPAVETLAWQPLTVDELRAFEPRVSSNVLGGFFVPTDRHVEPRSLSSGLRAWLRDSDVEVSVAERVVGFRHSHGVVTEVVTNRRGIRPKTVLLCTGSWTGDLVRLLGASVPIVGGRGYVLDYRRPPVELQRPLYLYEAKIAVSPFDDRTRLTGAMELGVQKLGASHRRVAGIARQLGDYIREWPLSLKGVEVESGLRPMTPDGLPVIGAVPGFRNAYLASGHAMLGITLGPATGAAVGLMIANDRAPESLKQLAPDRF
jgi:D-amino-acid dehydrogenase